MLSLLFECSCPCFFCLAFHRSFLKGSLATAGFGTALGVIRALSDKGLLEACYCTETRPYNQVSLVTHTRVMGYSRNGGGVPEALWRVLLRWLGPSGDRMVNVWCCLCEFLWDADLGLSL